MHFIPLLTTLAIASVPTPRFEQRAPYAGNPGAEVRALEYPDGMSIKVAFYEGKRPSNLPPVGIVAGYAMDISYLHFMAEALSRMGFPVYLVQPPGNGAGAMRSQLPGGGDGYHNTVEGLAALYLDGLGEALFNHYGRKTVLLGHSRAGYQLRFFLTGLRYDGTDSQGRPVLAYRKEALERAGSSFLALVSLYSPIAPDARLLSLAGKARDGILRLGELEKLMHEERDFFVETAGNSAALAAGFSPLNMLAGIYAPIAAIVNASIARELTMATVRGGGRVIENIARKRMQSLMHGERELDRMDRAFLDMMAWKYGSRVELPSIEELENDLEAARWMSDGADREALSHMMEFASRQPPTPAASEEMLRLAGKKEGIAGWKTDGVDSNGNAYSIIRALRKARKETPLPFFIFDAAGDGGAEATRTEARLICANGTCSIPGGHGGAVLNRSSIDELATRLRESCLPLLEPAKP